MQDHTKYRRRGPMPWPHYKWVQLVKILKEQTMNTKLATRSCTKINLRKNTNHYIQERIK